MLRSIVRYSARVAVRVAVRAAVAVALAAPAVASQAGAFSKPPVPPIPALFPIPVVTTSTGDVAAEPADSVRRRTPPDAADGGDPATLVQLAIQLDRPWMADTAEALRLLYAAAAQGYGPALSRLGIREEVRKRWFDAAFWFHLAADRSDHYGIHALRQADSGAVIFARYMPDEALAAAARHDSLARRLRAGARPRTVVMVAPGAARAGDPRAMRWLGEMYAEGDGVPRSDSLAGAWIHRAAEAGDEQAQALVEAHDKGMLDAWRRPASARDERAMLVDAASWLGHRYLEGVGGQPNDSAAVRWLTAAARHGSAEAQSSLGLLYASGRAVPKDEVAAYALLALGRTAAGADAQAKRLELATQLSREELTRAQAMMREWGASP